jgi:hypothetical protein
MLSIQFRTFLGLGLVIAATAASASDIMPSQTAEQRFDNRQDRQEQRIENGIHSGALTGPETRRLGREQAGLVRAEARAEADGRITRREAVRLEQRQDRASRHIAHAKHDRQTRKP